MPRLPRRYTLRQKSPNAPPRIRRALREVSDITLTLADFDWAAYNEGCQKAIAAMKNARNPMALGNNVWPAGVPFDWEAFTRAAAKQEEHYKKLGLIKCSEVSDRSDTEPESEAPETKDQSIVMAEISYPTDAEGSPVEHEKLPDAVWPFGRWWPR